MTYTASIRLNGVTTPYTCHDCDADVAIQHGAHPDNPRLNRHYYRCGNCGAVGVLYPLFNCEDCNRVSSKGGQVVTYKQPTVQRVFDHIVPQMEPLAGVAVQLRLFGH